MFISTKRIFCPLSINARLYRHHLRTYSFNNTPFDDNHLSIDEAVKQTLENDPNLEGFFHDVVNGKQDGPGSAVADDTNDGFDLSDIPILGADDIDPISIQMQNQNSGSQNLGTVFSDSMDQPITMSTADFIKRFQENDHFNENASTSQALSEVIQSSTKPSSIVVETKQLSSLFNTSEFDRYVNFMEKGDVYSDSVPINLKLSDIVSTSTPLVVVTKFINPKLNLAIEKYIYDNLPNPKEFKSAKRLILYKNSPCIVIGKNQNPYKEVNMKYASLLQIPIIRRYSGGGTVVHDLGNYNFSYISSQNEFDRVGFSTGLNIFMNQLVGLKYKEFKLPVFPLGTNGKGDIINAENEKKISGSAFQISRGKSLHHGTMLLNSNLKTLSKLLKLSDKRKKSIVDRSTNSIPSPVENMNISDDIFTYCAISSFISSQANSQTVTDTNTDYDNLEIFEHNGSKCKVLKIDDVADLPSEVFDIYENFNKWEWTFGSTPKFELNLDIDDLKVSFSVEKGVIKQVRLSRPEPALDNLVSEIQSSNVLFRGDVVRDLINEDSVLRDSISWGIDFNCDYQHLGTTTN